jgi:hypothetical protein
MIPWNLIIVIVATLLGFAGGLWTAMLFAATRPHREINQVARAEHCVIEQYQGS